jgi:hypothetical protein
MKQKIFNTLSPIKKNNETTFHNKQSLIQPQYGEFGLLPILSLVSAFALVLISIADTSARRSEPGAELLFWMGLLLIFIPMALRLTSVRASRMERIGLLVVFGLGLYLIKIMHSPLYFTFADELKHWRTANDVIKSHFLFKENPILPISPLYPGLQNATSALVHLSGLDIFSIGVILIGISRLMLILFLYLFYENISSSDRVAGIATLLYMTNPHFLFFDAQFSYESLALPFAVMILFALARRITPQINVRIGFTIAIFLWLGVVVTTHHITTYVLISFLIILTVMFMIVRNKQGCQNPGWIMFLAFVVCLTWVIYVASNTIDYIAPDLINVVGDFVISIIRGVTLRQLFSDVSGQIAPLWEQILGYLSAGLILIGLPFGLINVWRRYHKKTLSIALCGGALIFPITQLLRLTEGGSEISGRINPFLYVAVSFVLGIEIVALWPSHHISVKKRIAINLGVIAIFLGGITVSFPRWGRLPGSYLASADMRSVESQGMSAAEWARDFLGTDNRVGADRVNGLLMASYGQQFQVTRSYDWVDVPRVFLSPEIGITEREILHQGRIRYLVVDLRFQNRLPILGFYFEPGESNTKPISSILLTKFDANERVSRIFDSGDIVIYDVGLLTDAK